MGKILKIFEYTYVENTLEIFENVFENIKIYFDFLIFFRYLIAFVLLFDGRMLLSDWHLVSGCGRGYNRPLSLIPRQSHHHIQPMHNVLFEQYDGITITANPWSLNRHHHLHCQLPWIAVGIFSITHLHFMQRPKPPFSYFPRIKKSLIIIFFNSLLRPNLYSSHKMCDNRTHSWKNALTAIFQAGLAHFLLLYVVVQHMLDECECDT